METLTINYLKPGTRVMAKDYRSKARDMKPGAITQVNIGSWNGYEGEVNFSVSYNVQLDRLTGKGDKVYVSAQHENIEII